MLRKYSTTLSAVVLPLLLGACADFDTETTSESQAVAVAEQPIINGSAATSNPFVVAIYHPSEKNPSTGAVTKWLNRPCSGVILRRLSNTTTVLTARHCVTVQRTLSDGSKLIIGGTPVAAADLRLTTDLAPGALPVGGTPPANTIAANGLTVMDNPNNLLWDGDWSPARDLAIIRVPQALPLPAGTALSLNLVADSLLFGRTLRDWGYGVNVDTGLATDFDAIASGAGVLRTAGNFVVGQDLAGCYDYWNSGDSAIYHGDSGGPSALLDVFATSSGSATRYRVMGIHSRASATGTGKNVSIVDNWEWIQGNLGFMYLTAADGFGKVLATATNPPAVGAGLYYGLTADSSRVRWSYLPSSSEIRLYSQSYLYPNFCLTDSSGSARLQTCSGALTQKWTVTASLEIKNNSSSKCLRRNGALPSLGACDSTLQTKWLWLPQIF